MLMVYTKFATPNNNITLTTKARDITYPKDHFHPIGHLFQEPSPQAQSLPQSTPLNYLSAAHCTAVNRVVLESSLVYIEHDESKLQEFAELLKDNNFVV